MARYYRKVIRIRAEDSPNVRLALAQIAAGKEPTGEMLVPGVLPWKDYQKRRQLWDAIRQSIGLDAEFWEGKETLLYPPDWLNASERFAGTLPKNRLGKALGVDPAEGGDKTAMVVVDERGVLEVASRKTPDTDAVPREALAMMRRWQVPPENIVFDRGGGGKEHADRLRAQGYPVRTVGFGEAVTLQPKRGTRRLEEKIESREDSYAYRSRRSEMYGELRLLLDPSNERKFGIPAEYTELRLQLAPIPLTYDCEGRLALLPKSRRPGDRADGTKCLIDLIGHSPDEADALVLAVHGILHRAPKQVAGAV